MTSRYRRAAAMAAPTTLLRNRTIVPRWTGEGDTFVYSRVNDAGDIEVIRVEPELGIQSTLADGESGVAPVAAAAGLVASPDGRHEVFMRGFNLWLRNRTDDAERQLTFDGEEAFAWGALPDNTMVAIPLRTSGTVLPPAMTGFSPSGAKVLAARTDERSMPTRPFVESVPVDGFRPRLHNIRVAVDADEFEPNFELVVVDMATGAATVLDAPVGAFTTLYAIGIGAVAWSTDESKLWLLSHATGDSVASLLEFDTATGDCRRVLSESDDQLYEPNQFLYSLPLVRVLPEKHLVVWYSQRDGWAHLYRYDLDTGECLGRLTAGPLVVTDILRIDDEYLFFLAGRNDPGVNPYWRFLYRVPLDGLEPAELLTPEDCHHEFPVPEPAFFTTIFSPDAVRPDAISPSGCYCVDHMSTVSTPPVIVLRDLREGGRIVCELEHTDDTRLLEAGYVRPQSFCVTTDDGTDIWGVLTVPADPVDPASIPVIDLMYAGPQMSWQPSGYVGPGLGSGTAAPAAAYAALGFASVVLDGRGTPGRHRDFRRYTHASADMRRGLADHVEAIQKLAEMHPSLDLTRVGVTGFSFGGYYAARSMFLFPDFFRVAVSGAGVHVPEKVAKDGWSLLVGCDADRRGSLYQSLSNIPLVDRLRGKLMITFGELDENATADHSLALIAALIAADKKFDMKMWPGANHYTQMSLYHQRTAWDYFVEHL